MHLAQEIQETLETFRKQGQQKCDPISGQKFHLAHFFDPVTQFAVTVKITKPGFLQPPVLFEEKHGIEGISQRYNLPEGISPPELQAYAQLLLNRTDMTSDERIDKMTEAWSEIVAGNPVLEKIRYSPQDPKALFHMMVGVASAFNTNDIQNFIFETGHRPARKMRESSGFIKLTGAFNQRSKNLHLLQWVASPETLQLITDKIEAVHPHVLASKTKDSHPEVQP